MQLEQSYASFITKAGKKTVKQAKKETSVRAQFVILASSLGDMDEELHAAVTRSMQEKIAKKMKGATDRIFKKQGASDGNAKVSSQCVSIRVCLVTL